MEFTVRKFDLLQELTLIQGVVERKTTIPILGNVLLRAEGDELGITATDLEIGLKSACGAKETGCPSLVEQLGSASPGCHKRTFRYCRNQSPVQQRFQRMYLQK